MKKHWKQAPARIQDAIEAQAAVPVIIRSADGLTTCTSPAATWLATVLCAVRFGYTYDPPPTPMLDHDAELERTGNRLALNRFRQNNAVEISEERKALARWKGLEAWRAGPTNEEIEEQARLERDRIQREQAIETRARELLASEDAKRLEAARVAARRQLGGTK
jgi:hypothetical protein